MPTAEDPPGPLPPLPPLARSGAGEWTARCEAGIRAVLADDRLTVPPPGPGGPPGTVSWLRTAVSRFASGAEHRRRRALVEGELARLEPGCLRAAARERACRALAGSGRAGDRAEVMSLLARRVPVAALAARLGLADPGQAAEAVIAVAAGYFPGSPPAAGPPADAATAWLVAALRAAGPDLAVARITILVQACDATAGLIGTALHLLQDAPAGGAAWATDAVLAETLRYRPARRLRRVASALGGPGDDDVRVGDVVVCDIEAAGHDPADYDDPGRFDPGRFDSGRLESGWPAPPGLAFGAGLRPCPGPGQALALAAGVIDAVRERCALRPGTPVTYEAAPIRIPERLDVVLR